MFYQKGMMEFFLAMCVVEERLCLMPPQAIKVRNDGLLGLLLHVCSHSNSWLPSS